MLEFGRGRTKTSDGAAAGAGLPIQGESDVVPLSAARRYGGRGICHDCCARSAQPSLSQSWRKARRQHPHRVRRTGPAPTPPTAAAPAAPEQIAPPTTPAQPGDVFGEDTTLTAKTIIYVKGTGTWDKTFETITASFKKIKTYLDKEGIKPDGLPMTIFTATDDNGFDYEAAMPIAEPPKNPPHGEFAMGQTPDGAGAQIRPSRLV